jgi:hypothetical protein
MITYCPVCTTIDETEDREEIITCDTCGTEYVLTPETEQAVDYEYRAILFCPECCDSIDTKGTGKLVLTCPSGHGFTVQIDEGIVAEHGRFG